ERSSRRSDALASFERALELDPAYADAAANLGQLLDRDGETGRARKVLERALGMHPGHAGVRIGLAFTDSLEGRLTEARTTLEALAPSEPQNAALWEALGAVRIASGDLDGAETAYRRAADIDPHNPQASFGVAAALLGRGDYDNGWRAFEVRTDGCLGPARRFGDIPQWQGEDLDGTLMIYCEQGLGDVVQFARFVAKARARVKDVGFLAAGGWRSLAPFLSYLAGIYRLI